MSAARVPQEHHFQTHDGVPLFYRYWPAIVGPRRGAVLLFHRGHEHGARMAHLPDELDLPDFDFFAWDARGHGRSPGQRGDSPGFDVSVRDVQTFVDHIALAHGIAPHDMHLIAQSMGAVLVAAWAHDYAPKVRGLTLASPAFRIKLYVPFVRAALALMYRLRGPFFVHSYVKARFLTHDRVRIASYEHDPLISRAIAVDVLLGQYEAAERVVADANAITLPVQLLISGADWVVHRQPQHRFFEGLGSPVKNRRVLPGVLHDTLGEKDRGPTMQAIRKFVLDLFDAPPPPVDLRNAHLRGATASESRALAAALSPLSPQGAWWALARARLRLGGMLSRGISLGLESGFDSDSTLAYVDRNVPQGAGPIGRSIDRRYLNSIGSRGIRQRRIHVDELRRDAMVRLAAAQREVRQLDIARLEQADAFDRGSSTARPPRPTLVVVSGLYEPVADNAIVSRSLAGIAEAIEAGGYLLYTAQPWHPQLERVARVLGNRPADGAGAMRRRTQAEMDQLVEQAGFRKLAQRIDAWGIFSVSLAVRGGA